MRVARQSRFHRILGQGTHAGGAQEQARGSSSQGTAEPALPGRQCRPQGGDAEGGAGGIDPCGAGGYVKRLSATSSNPSKIRLSTSSKGMDMLGAIFQPAPPVM